MVAKNAFAALAVMPRPWRSSPPTPRNRNDVAPAWGLDGTGERRVAVERHVRPVLVVVGDVGSDGAQ